MKKKKKKKRQDAGTTSVSFFGKVFAYLNEETRDRAMILFDRDMKRCFSI